MKNSPCEAKNTVFGVNLGNLPTHYAGALLALRRSYVELTDCQTPIRHWNCGDICVVTVRFRPGVGFRLPQRPPCAVEYLDIPGMVTIVGVGDAASVWEAPVATTDRQTLQSLSVS